MACVWRLLTGNIYQRWGKHVSTKLISSFGITKKKQLQKSLILLSSSSYKRFSIYQKKKYYKWYKLRKLYHISYSHSAGNSFAPQNFLWSYKLEGTVTRCSWLHTFITFIQKCHAVFFKLYAKVFQYLFSTLFGNGGFVQQEVLH